MAKALDPKSRDISIEGLMKGPEGSIQTLVLATKKFQTFVLNFLSRKKIGTCSKIFADVMIYFEKQKQNRPQSGETDTQSTRPL